MSTRALLLVGEVFTVIGQVVLPAAVLVILAVAFRLIVG